LQQLYVKTRDEWRKWLSEHHQTERELWLVFFKKETGKPSIEYDASVEEALCFGWVDSIIKKIDAEKYARKFTPRKSGSLWSDSNKKRVKKMIAEGRMTEFGLARIEEANRSGLWDKSPRPDISFEIPEEFERALQQNKEAQEFFQQLAPSYQKQYIAWIVVAKRQETREKRIKESIALLKKGEKLGMK